MKYYPKMIGASVYLSPMSLDDAEVYTAWLNDLETTRYLTVASAQVTLQGERDFLVQLSKGHNYSIVEKASDRLLGSCGLASEDHVHRSAEVGIFLGDEAARGRGHGSEALSLLCDYAFNVLNFRSLFLRTYAFNERAIASYRKVGFKEIGRMRQAHFWQGSYHDVVLMDLLAEEFGPSTLPQVKAPR